MTGRANWTASAVVGGLVVLCTSGTGLAQQAPAPIPISRIASMSPGAIQGVVQDEGGQPLNGAMVSALGATTKFAVTDRTGHFELRTLSPGPYLLRAHLTGFAASRGQMVEVRPSAHVSSSIALQRIGNAVDPSAYPVLEAGIGPSAPAATPDPAVLGTSDGGSGTPGDDHGETAWRIRHARRGVLKDATIPEAVLADAGPDTFEPGSFLSHTFGSPARMASSLFDADLSGQFNLLTTGSFDSPQQLFTSDSFSRGVAYVSIGAPVGGHGDWAVRGALTQGDIASWVLAGSYTSRAAARHRYELGLTYSTQRYEGGNPAALVAIRDGSRNAGTVYGFDTWTVSRAVSLTYGGRYARYDYLTGHGLISPRIALTIVPTRALRINTLVSRRSLAPGAQEFTAPADGGIWLPPQRTFSPLTASRPLEAERTTHFEVEVERDMLAGATVSLRAFRQQVTNQFATLFGVRVPDMAAAEIGHYFVSTAGDVNATGWSAGVRSVLGSRFNGSVEYTESRAQWSPADDLGYLVLLAPSAVRWRPERVHDVSTSFEARVPETATRVLVLYRMSNGFARRDVEGDHPGFDTRFDVQVRQSLPFMNFSTAQWEMLVAVRNFFHETAADQSIYDELLVVHPPKRVVGGLTLRF